MSHNDQISLGSQTFYTMGPVRANSVAEFTTGLKIGSATYDQREHAFFLVLDDFSGGVGHRRLDIREELGTLWDNQGGVDVRRARHITLPPLQATAALTPPAAGDYTKRQPSVPIIGSDVSGSPAHYAGFGGSLYKSTTGGASWSKVKDISSAYMVSRILEFCPSAPAGVNALYAFCEGGSGTARYQRSIDGTTWADGGSGTQKVIEDAISFSLGIGGMVMVGTRPIAEIIYSSDGQTWNIDEPTDGYPLWKAGYGRVQFIGTFMAPWGRDAVHFLARDDAGLQGLFVLAFAERTAYPIPMGNRRHLHDAIVWNNYMVVTDGYSTWLWDGESVRNISWTYKGGGLPPGLRGGVIVKLIGGTLDYLYALLYTSAGATQIIAYNGAGWAQLGPAVPGFCSVVTNITSKWLPATVATERRIVALGASTFGGIGTPQLMTTRLPDMSDLPSVGLDHFQDGPLSCITGWINGGFQELSGALYRLYCDGFNIDATETVKIEYQLNNNESGAWTTLGTFTAAGQSLNFASPNVGLEFRTVRFQITLDRDGTDTNSPELMSLVLVYDKKPSLRTTWVAQIDVNRMIQEKVQVDGADATIANVWAKLKTLWNTKTLLAFTISNVETGTLYVKLADMPLTLDDFHSDIKGQGGVTIQFLEPVVG